MKLNEKETATVLFALRFLGANLQDLKGDLEQDEPLSKLFVRDDGTMIEEPDEKFIDALCFKMNTN